LAKKTVFRYSVLARRQIIILVYKGVLLSFLDKVQSWTKAKARRCLLI